MKILSVTILLICLIAATFSQWLLIADYNLNENYIAREFCKNKNNPHSHCNGHCFLNKQLNNEEKQSNPFRGSAKEKFEVQLFCVDTLNFSDIISFLITPTSSHLQNFFPQEVLITTFHPPCLA
jgi:hypothetical protein